MQLVAKGERRDQQAGVDEESETAQTAAAGGVRDGPVAPFREVGGVDEVELGEANGFGLDQSFLLCCWERKETEVEAREKRREGITYGYTVEFHPSWTYQLVHPLLYTEPFNACWHSAVYLTSASCLTSTTLASSRRTSFINFKA